MTLNFRISILARNMYYLLEQMLNKTDSNLTPRLNILHMTVSN